MFTNFEIMVSKSKVHFFFETPFSFKKKKALKQTVEQIFIIEKIPLSSLNFIFSTDNRLLGINKQFLNHDYYTDIITFCLSEKKAPIVGEVYISIDRLRENAKALNIPLTNEIQRVVFHGALHLCGYNDKKRKQKLEMRKKEDFFIRLLHK